MGHFALAKKRTKDKVYNIHVVLLGRLNKAHMEGKCGIGRET